MKILGIETSCDETGAAVYCSDEGLIAHQVYSQVTDHAPYGGVVPELAARDHIRKLLPLIDKLIIENSLADAIDAVAYTAGPGLVGALMVGATMGRALAWAWNCRAVAVNHLEAHLLAPMLEAAPPEPPFAALLVSGGHTLLFQVDELGHYHLLGESVDDAAGEAFDKVGQLLGLSYPGGPAVARLAEKGRSGRFDFPRPMIKRDNLNFSFSGLKTHVLYQLQETDQTQQDKADIARAFEDAVVDVLVSKCRRALHYSRLNKLVVAGGVGANQQLRKQLKETLPACELFYPRLEFCTDNGAMIAYAGYRRLLQGDEQQSLAVDVRPRWPL